MHCILLSGLSESSIVQIEIIITLESYFIFFNIFQYTAPFYSPPYTPFDSSFESSGIKKQPLASRRFQLKVFWHPSNVKPFSPPSACQHKRVQRCRARGNFKSHCIQNEASRATRRSGIKKLGDSGRVARGQYKGYTSSS